MTWNANDEPVQDEQPATRSTAAARTYNRMIWLLMLAPLSIVVALLGAVWGVIGWGMAGRVTVTAIAVFVLGVLGAGVWLKRASR